MYYVLFEAEVLVHQVFSVAVICGNYHGNLCFPVGRIHITDLAPTLFYLLYIYKAKRKIMNPQKYPCCSPKVIAACDLC